MMEKLMMKNKYSFEKTKPISAAFGMWEASFVFSMYLRAAEIGIGAMIITAPITLLLFCWGVIIVFDYLFFL